MSVPFLKTPEFNTKLPSGKEVTYRPFLVKEEKVMLTIKESKNVKDILGCMVGTVSNCIVSGADIRELSYNDIEHLFILMRCRSVGEEVEINHKCKACGKESPVSIDISNIGLSKEYPESDVVMLNDEIGITVRPLGVDGMGKVAGIGEDNPLETIQYIVHTIFNSENVYNFADLNKKEKQEFVDSLSLSQVKQIMEKMAEFPRCSIKVNVTCPHCGEQEEINVEGIENFFT
jgi:DNA-directed RNA polymerase subunit M/transcription elongation factor TFIIS